VSSAEHKAPRYVVISTPLLPSPSQPQISSSAPYFRTLSAYMLLSVLQTNFRTHIIQQAKAYKEHRYILCAGTTKLIVPFDIRDGEMLTTVRSIISEDETSDEAFPYTLAPRRHSEVTVLLNIHAMNLKCSSKLSDGSYHKIRRCSTDRSVGNLNAVLQQMLYRRFHKITKSGCYVCLSVCLSVRLHGTSRLPLDGFS